MTDVSPVSEELLTHAAFVRRLARSLLVDRHEAEDVAQDTFRVALEHAEAGKGDLRAWLATVVRNLAFRRGRGEARRGHHERAGARDDILPASDSIVGREEVLQLVVTAVCELHEPYRSAILARYYEGLPPRTIALRCDVSVDTVNTRLKRARIQLQDKLESKERDWRVNLALLVGRPHRPPGSDQGQAARRPGSGRVQAIALAATALLLVTGAWIALDSGRSRTGQGRATSAALREGGAPRASNHQDSIPLREPLMPTFLLAAALALPSSPQCSPPPTDRWFPDPGDHLEFGLEVAISGEWAVVGAALEDSTFPPLVDSGAAYVYRRSTAGWVQFTKLTATDAAAFNQFGTDVDIDGDTIVVGARGHDHASNYWIDAGSAYVFEHDGGQWVQSTELLGSDMSASVIEYGSKVSLSGDTIVVSSPYDDSSCGASGTECGAVYVFVEPTSGWQGSPVHSETVKLVSPTPEDGSRFGADVRIDGGTVVVGASHEDSDGVFDSGAVHVFEEPPSGWSSGALGWARIVPEHPQPESGFGVRVDVQSGASSPDRVVIGAHRHSGLGGRSVAFVVEEPGGGWASLAGNFEVAPNLFSKEATAFPIQDTFGIGVAIHGDLVVVGAPTDDPPLGDDVGSAFVFTRLSSGIWFETHRLQADLPSTTGHFYPYLGGGVALEGQTVLVGAHLDDNVFGPDVGTVLIYELQPCHLRRSR